MSIHRAVLAAVMFGLPVALLAQSGGPGGRPTESQGGGSGGLGSGRPGALTPEQREAARAERRGGGEGPGVGQRPLLEQQIRERFAGVVRNQLRLDDRQMRQLGDVSRRFEGRRRGLNVRERSARDVLRTEVAADRNADNPRVATALQEILSIQKERTAIVEDEDKELANFLTPVQRARWFALQDQFRRRVEELRRHGPAGVEVPGGSEPPGGGDDR